MNIMTCTQTGIHANMQAKKKHTNIDANKKNMHTYMQKRTCTQTRKHTNKHTCRHTDMRKHKHTYKQIQADACKQKNKYT